ncbi:MAG: hypothetical protein U9Q04_05640 [Campylobacterota bacterium]|nr:hypothetical protein [Campylobacterota bacterium]
MIDALYKLKQQQINQQVSLKQQALSKINEIDDEMRSTDKKMHTATIDTMGSISDFRVLQIHKETMKSHIIKLHQTKEHLKKKIEQYDKIIVELNKESEQYNYILEEEKILKAKEILKNEELTASEYVQAKFVRQKMMEEEIA